MCQCNIATKTVCPECLKAWNDKMEKSKIESMKKDIETLKKEVEKLRKANSNENVS